LDIFLLSRCKQVVEVTAQSKPQFAIDLQTGFEHDIVQVQLDHEVIYHDTTTTSRFTLACRLTPIISSGSHRIQVSVPSLSIEADTIVTAQDTLVVGVNLDRSAKQLSFSMYRFWVMYR
jgi:hypothetical protein